MRDGKENYAEASNRDSEREYAVTHIQNGTKQCDDDIDMGIIVVENEQGSIVVEAALSLPFFLTFILVLIVFVQLAITEMALQTVVSEAVKQVSTHYTPIYALLQKGEEEALKSLEKTTIPPFLQSLAMEGLGMTVEKAMPLIVEPYIKTMADERILNKQRLHVVSVKLPKETTAHNAFFEVEIEYRVWIRLPFFERELSMRKKATERAWIGER